MIHEILLILNAICLLLNCLRDNEEKDIINKIACVLNFLAIVGLSLVLYFE